MIHVAVGVVENRAGQVLLALRQTHQHQGGLWEFPGGKVEPGESTLGALRRELLEEVGINVESASPLIKIPHHYKDKSVLLDVWVIRAFSGNAAGLEGQLIQWVSKEQLSGIAFPEANKPIVNSLILPSCIAIASNLNLPSAEIREKLVLSKSLGVEAVLLRGSANHSLLCAWKELAQEMGVRLGVHEKVGAENLQDFNWRHLSSQSISAESAKQMESGAIVGASCHNLRELQCAQDIGCSYAFLSPVFQTSSHPGAIALGWESFRNMVERVAIPVFALGGLSPGHLTEAKNFGAQGVVGISKF